MSSSAKFRISRFRFYEQSVIQFTNSSILSIILENVSVRASETLEYILASSLSKCFRFTAELKGATLYHFKNLYFMYFPKFTRVRLIFL